MASTLPPGFIVVQLEDNRWYPIEVRRYYSSRYPQGDITLSTCIDSSSPVGADAHFKRRGEAVAYCQQKAQADAAWERSEWERVAVGSDLHPERCSHYLDLITEITGHAPAIYRFMYNGIPQSAISISPPCWRCSCGIWHLLSFPEKTFLFIEDALAEVANAVYASFQECQCSQLQEERAHVAV